MGMMQNIKTSKSVVFDTETLEIVTKAMYERGKNFSECVNLLIRNGEIAFRQLELERIKKIEAQKEAETQSKLVQAFKDKFQKKKVD